MQQLSYSLSEGHDREYKIKVEGGKKGNPLYMHHLTSYSAIMTVIHDSQAFSKELEKRLKPLCLSLMLLSTSSPSFKGLKPRL